MSQEMGSRVETQLSLLALLVVNSAPISGHNVG